VGVGAVKIVAFSGQQILTAVADCWPKRQEYLPNIHRSAAPLAVNRKSACEACRLRITIAQRLWGNALVLRGFAHRSGSLGFAVSDACSRADDIGCSRGQRAIGRL
jgi:hypothetical protein